MSDFSESQLRVLRALADGILSAQGGAASKASAVTVSDADLDSQYGDPILKRDPPRYVGPSFAGKHYSETTPEYLDEVAKFQDWRAQKDDEANAMDDKGRPKSYWPRKEAALARGHAARLRARGTQAEPTQATFDASLDESDIPF